GECNGLGRVPEALGVNREVSLKLTHSGESMVRFRKDLRPTLGAFAMSSGDSTFTVPRRGLLSCTSVPSTVELAGLAKYPFLQEASAFIRAEHVTLEELLSEPAYARARAIGRARVVEALEKGPDAKRVEIGRASCRERVRAWGA